MLISTVISILDDYGSPLQAPTVTVKLGTFDSLSISIFLTLFNKINKFRLIMNNLSNGKTMEFCHINEPGRLIHSLQVDIPRALVRLSKVFRFFIEFISKKIDI